MRLSVRRAFLPHQLTSLSGVSTHDVTRWYGIHYPRVSLPLHTSSHTTTMPTVSPYPSTHQATLQPCPPCLLTPPHIKPHYNHAHRVSLPLHTSSHTTTMPTVSPYPSTHQATLQPCPPCLLTPPHIKPHYNHAHCVSLPLHTSSHTTIMPTVSPYPSTHQATLQPCPLCLLTPPHIKQHYNHAHCVSLPLHTSSNTTTMPTVSPYPSHIEQHYNEVPPDLDSKCSITVGTQTMSNLMSDPSLMYKCRQEQTHRDRAGWLCDTTFTHLIKLVVISRNLYGFIRSFTGWRHNYGTAGFQQTKQSTDMNSEEHAPYEQEKYETEQLCWLCK